MTPRAPGRAAKLALAAGLLAACILPDRGIVIVDENVQNKHPVRFVEPTPITPEALDTCLSLAEVKAGEDCQPGNPATVLPRFLDPNVTVYDFCSCGVDTQKDQTPLTPFTLYVEDRTNEAGGDLDPIFAALMIDLRPDEEDPSRKVAYQNYVSPTLPLKEPLQDSIKYEPPRRPDTGRELRQINLGDPETGGIDLCNSGPVSLPRGYHTLRVIVTDAPWFNPTPDDEMNAEIGVPDLANGATYDTLEYVFHCSDKTDPDDKSKHCDKRCVKREL